jgi:hypothetical protein
MCINNQPQGDTTMFAKTGVAVSIAICLGAAGAALASERDSSGGYQARQGIQEPSYLSFTTDVGRAYALDESSKSKKKAPKQEKTGPTSTSGSAPDEATRLRHYQDNH